MSVALDVEKQLSKHSNIVVRQSNDDLQRIMRRDIERHLYSTPAITEPQIESPAVRILELARWRSARFQGFVC